MIFKGNSNFGVSRIIYTDINKDEQKGPNIKDTIELSSKVKIPFIISGGISCRIKKIKSLNNSNIEGVILESQFMMVNKD